MKLLAIDGNSLVNRAFYGVRPLTSPKGEPTNAVYGFLNMYLKLLDEHKPDCVCVCFDVHAKTFRHIEFEQYKAQRKPMPEELKAQMPVIKEMLDYMGVPRLEAEGFEADDLLGTLARECRECGMECVIVTGDRDSLQFIAQGAKVALVISRLGVTSTEVYDEQVFADKYCGLTPDKIVDMKALMGDSSDNIPGVRGIGEKGALTLLCRFGSLDNIYANLDDTSLTPNMRKRLTDNKDMAYLSYWLATGCLEAPVPVTPDKLTLQGVDNDKLFDRLKALGLDSIIRRMHLTPSRTKHEIHTFKMPEVVYVGSRDALIGIAQELDTPAALVINKAFSAGALCTDEACYVFTVMQLGEVIKDLFDALSDKRVCINNSKSLLSELLRAGCSLPQIAFDSALAGYLLDPLAGNYDIKTLALRYLDTTLPDPVFEDDDAFDLLGGGERALSALSFYAAAGHALTKALTAELDKTQMSSLLFDMEIPLSRVLAYMEYEGVGVNKDHLVRFGESITGDIDRLESEIYELAGERFNIASPKQLSEILYDKLQLSPGKKNRTGHTTNAETLEKLKHNHPIVSKILDYRKLTKLKSTYVEGLLKALRPTGRVYGRFNQTVTATGRLSSTEPNLQNIPIRQELGAEIRKSFVPREGWVLVDADYSQIELRLLAHIAGDGSMIQAFRNGEDIHTATASQVFDLPASEITPLLRSRAKAVNFGIVYGMSAHSLGEDIGVSFKEAQSYISAYLDHYSGVKNYMDDIKLRAEQDGFVSTVYGRRRYLPELRSSNFNVRAFGQRVALNAPIQGTAADIIKIAMIRVHQRLEREALRTRLILQVHDELILECPPEELEQVKTLLKEEMENACSLSVRLTAEVSTGENWYDAKK
ncbi:MAG: DNA polymerase I [Clostridia bacterium]|nr:DNA polymerase I [Clostridia bacterium]